MAYYNVQTGGYERQMAGTGQHADYKILGDYWDSEK